jgi:death-on-curing protein
VTPIFLTLGEILEIHKDQIKRYGGKPGIRDMGLLQSALAMPAAGLHDRYLHNDLLEMAAAYLFHIIQNHPFIDGNKRTGAVAALVFLLINKTKLDINEDELEEIVLSTAQGKTDKSAIASFFRKNCKK